MNAFRKMMLKLPLLYLFFRTIGTFAQIHISCPYNGFHNTLQYYTQKSNVLLSKEAQLFYWIFVAPLHPKPNQMWFGQFLRLNERYY